MTQPQATRIWFASALLLLVAVPYQTYWEDFESARRGVMACLCGVVCLVPHLLPGRTPRTIWPMNVLALWALLRCLFVTNTGYGLEAASHWIALAVLMILGTGMPLPAVLRATLPTGVVVAGVGIAQAFGYSLVPDTTEAVSTLGNRNVASEVIAMCGAAAALLASLRDTGKVETRLALITLGLCAVAVTTNTSRSGLIALALGCLPCLLLKPRAAPVAALATVAAGIALAFVLAPTSVTDATTTRLFDGSTARAEHLDPDEQPPSTLEVRQELWKGTSAMITAQPLLGFGPGQFRVEYPRYRTVREIELSSFARRFQTSPDTAHNDYLQITAELGIPGLILAGLTLFLVLRRASPGLWGPIVAFLGLAAVRAPLTNAPAAATLFLFMGALLRRTHLPGAPEFSLAPRRQLIKGIAAGLLLLWFGLVQVWGQVASTGFVARMAANEDFPGAMQAVDRVLMFRPHDHDFRLVRAREKLKRQETLRDARRDIEALLRMAPALPAVQTAYALLLNAEGQPDAALKILNELRTLRDPENQRAIQITVTILVRHGRAADAIQVLYGSRHPRTRQSLARTLAGLAEEAKTTADQERLRCEAAFIRVIDELRDDPRSIRVVDAIRAFAPLAAKVGAGTRDMRFFVVQALAMCGLNQSDQAAELARLAQNRSLRPEHRRLLEPVLAPLRKIPEWRERLGDG